MHFDLLLVGFGSVARRFVRLLEERADVLRDRYDLQAQVIGACTARHGAAFDPKGLPAALLLDRHSRGLNLNGSADATADRDLTVTWLLAHAKHDAAAALDDGRLVLVETTPLDVHHGGRPAIDHVRAGLEAGAHVVTANKGPVAFAYHDLAALAQKVGRRFLFEGAVMDGIPIFNLVRETLPGCEIVGFRGVVNATTNYILTAMERGQLYEVALAEMQHARIAEADPSHDVDGWDAAAKTAALINVLMDGDATPLTIAREGIRGITSEQMRGAVARGRRIRLVASARRDDDQAVGCVRPEELDEADPLAQLVEMQNAIILETDLLGRLGILQLDGGLTQTAYGLLSDVMRCQTSSSSRAPVEGPASG
ncbi:MAG: homoserine dehydrogenase [Acidobacteria bacterium]|nr:homoserine dehydrogenase [Acidobacteriota bacterium]